MRKYNHKDIEKKWQKFWKETEIYKTKDDWENPAFANAAAGKAKYYVLDMFPYPSGAGLHVGHPKGYIATDIVARMKMMQGFNVLHPMGWDAFGLPAENYALKNKVHPAEATEKNIATFKKQLELLGFTYDWDREVTTTDPAYYKWTQWTFIQMFKKGLAYESYEPINWCAECKTGLANEDLEGGMCERCGSVVEQKPLRQWVIRITDYAERLLKDLELLPEWESSIKEMQRNWIGRSEGAEVIFSVIPVKTGIPGSPIESGMTDVKVFTTRPDTLFGATYVVVAPEHSLIKNQENKIENLEEVKEYIKKASNKTDLERTDLAKEKTGVEVKGLKAINPVNGEELPIWVADYVLSGYGTGAIMAVPAHDERDWEFAKKFGLEIKEVLKGGDVTVAAFTEDGEHINSEMLNGLNKVGAIEKISSWLQEKGLGTKKVQYKLRDWVFSRQRYWGEPIPLVNCEKCGWVPVPDDQLPLELPKVKNYEPSGTGESPLVNITDWVNTACPHCGGPGKRETNTMPQWAGSCWYYLRYIDNKNDKVLVDKEKEKKWSPVDLYVGGAEHATRHLLYARFWHKFLFDIGAVNYVEPFKKLQHVGLILAEDGRKMSKRWNNVINPNEIVAEFGADSMRLYEMFMGPFAQPCAWSTKGVVGMRRFLERVWNLQEKVDDFQANSILFNILHKTIKKVTEDINDLKFNTAISSLMILVNAMSDLESVSKDIYEKTILLLAPFSPHVCEELWQVLGHNESIVTATWPIYDPELIKDESVNIVVQINGKVRDQFIVPVDITGEEIKKQALESEKIQKWLEGKEPKKVIYIPGKLVSIVI